MNTNSHDAGKYWACKWTCWWLVAVTVEINSLGNFIVMREYITYNRLHRDFRTFLTEEKIIHHSLVHDHFIMESYMIFFRVIEGAQVVREGISMTWNVLSWSGGHEFKPRFCLTWGALYFCLSCTPPQS